MYDEELLRYWFYLLVLADRSFQDLKNLKPTILIIWNFCGESHCIHELGLEQEYLGHGCNK